MGNQKESSSRPLPPFKNQKESERNRNTKEKSRIPTRKNIAVKKMKGRDSATI